MKAPIEFVEYRVMDLFETFEVSNPSLFKTWVTYLQEYSEETIKAAWKNIIFECKPRFLPEFKRVARILDEMRYMTDKPRQVAELKMGEQSQFSQVLKMCQLGMTNIQKGVWTEADYYEQSAKMYEDMKMHDAADELRRNI